MTNKVNCLECNKSFDCQTDLWLCKKCMDKFDTDRLWNLHDKNKLDALDFNENKALRESFRFKINKKLKGGIK